MGIIIFEGGKAIFGIFHILCKKFKEIKIKKYDINNIEASTIENLATSNL